VVTLVIEHGATSAPLAAPEPRSGGANPATGRAGCVITISSFGARRGERAKSGGRGAALARSGYGPPIRIAIP
jgi:hypothetical protein